MAVTTAIGSKRPEYIAYQHARRTAEYLWQQYLLTDALDSELRDAQMELIRAHGRVLDILHRRWLAKVDEGIAYRASRGI